MPRRPHRSCRIAGTLCCHWSLPFRISSRCHHYSTKDVDCHYLQNVTFTGCVNHKLKIYMSHRIYAAPLSGFLFSNALSCDCHCQRNVAFLLRKSSINYMSYSIRVIPLMGNLLHHFQPFVNYFVWLRITDEGSVPEMRIWSILLIKSDLKWCIHVSRSLFLYFKYPFLFME